MSYRPINIKFITTKLQPNYSNVCRSDNLFDFAFRYHTLLLLWWITSWCQTFARLKNLTKMFNPEERLFFKSSVWQNCLEFTKPKSSDINKRESRYTIKGTYWNMSKSSIGFLLTYLIAFVELYIKTHKCNSLMNNRRIVIVNIQ